MSQLPSFKAEELDAMLYKRGWREVDQEGSHRQFKHPVLPGRITIEHHKGATLPTGTVKGIFKSAGLLDEFKMLQRGITMKTIDKKYRGSGFPLQPDFS